MTTGQRRTHDFCWINLMTGDAEAARAFYAKLFGWTYGEMPGVPGGQLIEVGSQTAGAFMDLAKAQMPAGTPAVIGAMIKVDDAAATVAKVEALGGRGGPVHDALENGRMALCHDPNGAGFGLWQPKKEQGFDVDSQAHGAPSWFETITTDVTRAVRFYEALFGWTTEAQQPFPGMTYYLFHLGGERVAGAMQRMPHMAHVPPYWGTTFTVRNADESVRVAEELGATIHNPVGDIPGVGRFAHLMSPQGVSFSIAEWAR